VSYLLSSLLRLATAAHCRGRSDRPRGRRRDNRRRRRSWMAYDRNRRGAPARAGSASRGRSARPAWSRCSSGNDRRALAGRPSDSGGPTGGPGGSRGRRGTCGHSRSRRTRRVGWMVANDDLDHGGRGRRRRRRRRRLENRASRCGQHRHDRERGRRAQSDSERSGRGGPVAPTSRGCGRGPASSPVGRFSHEGAGHWTGADRGEAECHHRRG
jgi:hypothetical protein